MVGQEQGSMPTGKEVRKIVSEEVSPLLEKLTEIVDRMERYQQHDIEFKEKLLFLISQMFKNQEISMEGFDRLDSFLRKEFNWGK